MVVLVGMAGSNHQDPNRREIIPVPAPRQGNRIRGPRTLGLEILEKIPRPLPEGTHRISIPPKIESIGSTAKVCTERTDHGEGKETTSPRRNSHRIPLLMPTVACPPIPRNPDISNTPDTSTNIRRPPIPACGSTERPMVRNTAMGITAGDMANRGIRDSGVCPRFRDSGTCPWWAICWGFPFGSNSPR